MTVTESEIIIGNDIIATYMNRVKEEVEADFYRTADQNIGREPRYHYHRAWVWLMPVVTKIIKQIPQVKLRVDLVKNETRTSFYNFAGIYKDITHSHEDAIISMWLAVVDIIKWYENRLN